MQAGVEFLLQNHHDGALNLDSREALEGFGSDSDRIMRLAAGRGTGMAGMFGAVIGDFQLDGLESFRQKVTNSHQSVSRLWHL